MDGDTVLLPGIELIDTGGHVPGHQSLLVHLPKMGNVLLAIDVIPGEIYATRDDRPISPYDMDTPAARASVRKLLDIAQRENVALFIRGHDTKQWPTLRKSPEAYE